MTLENSIATTQRTLWNSKAMPYFRETSISFFSVCGYKKLNKVNEGDLVVADVRPWTPGLLLNAHKACCMTCAMHGMWLLKAGNLIAVAASVDCCLHVIE